MRTTQKYAQLVKFLSETHPSIQFGKVDVDELDDVAMAARVRSMPTFQVHINGAVKPELEFSGANVEKLTQLAQSVEAL